MKENFDDENKSVHLESWPEVNKNVDNELLNDMKKIRKIVSVGLFQYCNTRANIKY